MWQSVVYGSRNIATSSVSDTPGTILPWLFFHGYFLTAVHVADTMPKQIYGVLVLSYLK